MIDNVTVIIRTSNERTIELCKKLIAKEVPDESIFVIEESPFSKALIKTFEIGLKRNLKWTLAVDGDLILMPNVIERMLESAGSYGNELYVYQGQILDKFRCGVKYGGPHLYLTQNLDKVKTYFNLIENELRPESFLYKKMSEIGYGVISDRKLFALHDFEQHYNDIYRKSFFHGIKHQNWKNLLPLWLEKSKTDLDYKVALYGFINGFHSQNNNYPSVSELIKSYEQLNFEMLEMTVKNEIDSLKENFFEDILLEYKTEVGLDLAIKEQIAKNPKKMKALVNRLFKYLSK